MTLDASCNPPAEPTTVDRDASAFERAFWLPTAEDALSAVLNLPPGLQSPARAVVMLYPPFEERKAVQRLMVETARSMAVDGAVVLRVDPRGIGDSPGAFESFLPEHWTRDWLAADSWMRRVYPGLPRVWLGVRLSALWAVAAAHEEPLPNGLIAWAPFASGEQALAQWIQRYRVNRIIGGGGTTGGRSSPDSLTRLRSRLAEGETLDLDGFLITPELFRALDADNVNVRPPLNDVPSLIVQNAPDSSIAAAWRCVLPRIETVVHRVPPFWNAVGLVDADPFRLATNKWLSLRVHAAKTRLPGYRPPDVSRGETSETSLPRHIEIRVAGRTLRGMLQYPKVTPAASKSRILMLHGWSGGRIGPQRLLTLASRHFSAMDALSLRFDFRGRGDSDGDTRAASSMSMAEDALAALQWMQTHTSSHAPLIVVGLCSGCKAAIHVASRSEIVRGLVLWSPEPMGYLRGAQEQTTRRKTREALVHYGRKLLHPATWRKFLRGRVNVGMVRKALTQHEMRNENEAEFENASLARFARTPRPVLTMHGGADPETAIAQASYEAYCKRHDIPIESHIVEDANHNFSGADWRDTILEHTRRWIEARHFPTNTDYSDRPAPDASTTTRTGK